MIDFLCGWSVDHEGKSCAATWRGSMHGWLRAGTPRVESAARHSFLRGDETVTVTMAGDD